MMDHQFNVLILGLIVSCSLSTVAQMYEIPGAVEQPTWVCPVQFIDGSGSKDTLYFGFDENSTPLLSDTIFGERVVNPADTDFSVCLLSCDTPRHSVSVSPVLITGFRSLSFKNYIPPLRVVVDTDLFYSDSLPYPAGPGLPKIKMLLSFLGSVEDCPDFPIEGLIYLSDTSDGSLVCSFSDTVVIDFSTQVNLAFLPWSLGTQIEQQQQVDTCPKAIVSSTSLVLDNSTSQFSKNILYDLMGRPIFYQTRASNQNHHIPLADLSRGMYVLRMSNRASFCSRKIFIP